MRWSLSGFVLILILTAELSPGADISRIGKLAGIILLVSTSLAYGQFFTYSGWEQLPEEERQVYLAGCRLHHDANRLPNIIALLERRMPPRFQVSSRSLF